VLAWERQPNIRRRATYLPCTRDKEPKKARKDRKEKESSPIWGTQRKKKDLSRLSRKKFIEKKRGSTTSLSSRRARGTEVKVVPTRLSAVSSNGKGGVPS